MDDFANLAAWRQWLAAQGMSTNTVRMYSYGVFRLLTEHVEGPIASTREQHVVSFLNAMGNRAVAKGQYFRGVRSLFRYCHVRGLVPINPTEGIRLRKARRPPPVVLEEEELIRYFVAAAWRHPRRAWTLMLAFGIGARRMELAGITPLDVQGDTVLLRHCKGGKRRRVELGPYASAALQELQPWWNGTVLGGVGPQTITEWAHQAAVDSGLLPKVEHRVAHVLRASFATHLLRRGVPIEVVRDLMGHENLSTTNYYAAVADHERKAAVARLDFGG